MSGSVFIKGAEHEITGGRVCIGGTTYRQITRGVACIGGTTWVTIANFVEPMSVSVSPGTAYGYANPLKPIPQTVTTSFLTATPTGGKAPYTYNWTITSHTGTSPVLNSPHSASTNASATVAANTDQVATAHVTVTDALGSTAGADGSLVFSNQSQIG